MGDGRIFLKNLHDTSINKDLSNEPNFGLKISLDSTFNNFLESALNKISFFSSLNPILRTWFRDSCYTCDGSSTYVFPLLLKIGNRILTILESSTKW
jgi:hypothetical protein